MNRTRSNTIALIILCIFLFNTLLKKIDSKYGETLPKIAIDQAIIYDTNIFNLYSGGHRLRIDASYTGIDSDSDFLKKMESSITRNWEPYLKKQNTVVVTLDFSNRVITPELTGNDCCYKAAKSGLDAVKIAYKDNYTSIAHKNLKNAKITYKFTVK